MTSNVQSRARGKILINIARTAILQHFQAEKSGHQNDSNEDWLQEKAACFVTLTQNGQLRGCIGSLQAQLPLRQDVSNNAIAAAFRDPRFSPLTIDEMDNTDIEISLLSPMEALIFNDEQDALSKIRVSTDGLVFEYAQHRSTFLPQVWQQLPTVDEFMAHLKQKAGLSPDFWADGIKLQRYTVTKWQEGDDEQ